MFCLVNPAQLQQAKGFCVICETQNICNSPGSYYQKCSRCHKYHAPPPTEVQMLAHQMSALNVNANTATYYEDEGVG
jgi:hypothetical protein